MDQQSILSSSSSPEGQQPTSPPSIVWSSSRVIISQTYKGDVIATTSLSRSNSQRSSRRIPSYDSTTTMSEGHQQLSLAIEDDVDRRGYTGENKSPSQKLSHDSDVMPRGRRRSPPNDDGSPPSRPAVPQRSSGVIGERASEATLSVSPVNSNLTTPSISPRDGQSSHTKPRTSSLSISPSLVRNKQSKSPRLEQNSPRPTTVPSPDLSHHSGSASPPLSLRTPDHASQPYKAATATGHGAHGAGSVSPASIMIVKEEEVQEGNRQTTPGHSPAHSRCHLGTGTDDHSIQRGMSIVSVVLRDDDDNYSMPVPPPQSANKRSASSNKSGPPPPPPLCANSHPTAKDLRSLPTRAERQAQFRQLMASHVRNSLRKMEQDSRDEVQMETVASSELYHVTTTHSCRLDDFRTLLHHNLLKQNLPHMASVVKAACSEGYDEQDVDPKSPIRTCVSPPKRAKMAAQEAEEQRKFVDVMSIPLPRHLYEDPTVDTAPIVARHRLSTNSRGRQRPSPQQPSPDGDPVSKQLTARQWIAFVARMKKYEQHKLRNAAKLQQEAFRQTVRPRPIVNPQSIRLLRQRRKGGECPPAGSNNVNTRLFEEASQQRKIFEEQRAASRTSYPFKPTIAKATIKLLTHARKPYKHYENTFNMKQGRQEKEYDGQGVNRAMFSFKPMVSPQSHDILAASKSCPKSFHARLALSIMKYLDRTDER